MILVTGGTGFIGQSLIRQLVEAGYQVRVLIRPSQDSPRLPHGIPLEIAVSSLNDSQGLQAAMVGVDTVFHLIGGERHGAHTNLLEIDIQGTLLVSQAASQARVNRLLTISHLGADRASAYPVLKAKGIAEEHIRRSGIDFTILRTALVYGPDDSFTTKLAQLIAGFPFIFLQPGEGDTLIQPLWLEDLTTCLVWAMEDNQTRNEIYSIGGPEYITFHQAVEIIMAKIKIQKPILSIKPPYLRGLTVTLESIFRNLPISVFWLDYLATHRTASLDTIPRNFNLMPSRFSQQLGYLSGKNWRKEFWNTLWSGSRSKKSNNHRRRKS